MKLQDRTELARYFNELGFKVGAEVGVSKGRFSEILCQAIPDLKLFCIDPWDKYLRRISEKKQQTIYRMAQRVLSKYNASLIREFSMDAVKNFEPESLDFVFIDGNHEFDYVIQDIIEWSKRVRKGGIVAGHDYYNFKNSGVIEAVKVYTDVHKIEFNLTGVDPDSRDDKEPSFWWTKQ